MILNRLENQILIADLQILLDAIHIIIKSK
jgi:hypothetical protein